MYTAMLDSSAIVAFFVSRLDRQQQAGTVTRHSKKAFVVDEATTLAEVPNFRTRGLVH